MSRRGGAGFLLIELLVVIAIVGILTAIGASFWTQQLRDARDAADRTAATMIEGGLERYFADRGEYPEACTIVTVGPFMRRWPVRADEPVREGTAPGQYTYQRDADGQDYTLTLYLRSGDTFTLPAGIRPPAASPSPGG